MENKERLESFMVNGQNPCRLQDGVLLYCDENYFLNLVDLNTAEPPKIINNFRTGGFCYAGDGRIVCVNYDDGECLYLLNINDGSVKKINNVRSGFPCYTENDDIFYVNIERRYTIFKKSIQSTSIGTQINKNTSFDICFVGGEYIVYHNLHADPERCLVKQKTSIGASPIVINNHFARRIFHVKGNIIGYVSVRDFYLADIKNGKQICMGIVYGISNVCYMGNGIIAIQEINTASCITEEDKSHIYMKNISEYLNQFDLSDTDSENIKESEQNNIPDDVSNKIEQEKPIDPNEEILSIFKNGIISYENKEYELAIQELENNKNLTQYKVF